VAVAGAEATQEVQHQGTIDNWLAEIAERVSERKAGGWGAGGGCRGKKPLAAVAVERT
jgi:hypothetical protein